MSLLALKIKQELEQLNTLMLRAEEQYQPLLGRVHPSQRQSALNLLHYLVFRSLDMGELQETLHEEGYSSFANAESHIRSQVLAVLKHFSQSIETAPCSFRESRTLLRQRAQALFGNREQTEIPAIMVTLKSSHAQDPIMVKKLLRSGMNIARINCAHDNEDTWLKIISNIRVASEHTGLGCKVYMDLAGPKIRTIIKGAPKDRLQLEEEDEFILSDDALPHRHLPVVYTTVPGIAAQLKEEERVLFDDGLFEARVLEVNEGWAVLEVVRAPAQKPHLKVGKGINFPDSQLSLSALTASDRKALAFILKHADMIGYSFIHNIPDLEKLRQEMREKKLPIILKIETPEAFQHLPGLLFNAMEDELFGVMIARGDLAVELGFEQLSETQDVISWVCDAAHVPLIWATQVLENLNKTGLATRSEITDASLGVMAECVMLNKGAHVVQSIKVLKRILERSAQHRLKKRYLLRPLPLARQFLAGSTADPVLQK